MSVYVNKPMFEKRTEEAMYSGLAFFAGFLHGVTSQARETDFDIMDSEAFNETPNESLPEDVKKQMHNAIESVYTDTYNKYGELSNPARSHIKKSLEEREVGVTDEGINFLWDGYVEALGK